MDLRYSTPRMADALNGINNFQWGWLDPVSGKRCDCTNPINGTFPSDRHGDVIFIVDVQKVQDYCFILWYDKTNEVVFLDIGGMEPQYILGCIETATNTVVLKNAQKIENMKERYAEDARAWKEQHTSWGVFTEFVYKIIDLEIDDSNNSLDRGDQTPPFEERNPC